MLGHNCAGNISLLKWAKDEGQYQWYLTSFRTINTALEQTKVSSSVTKLYWFSEQH
jgi:hypothetical protein